MGLYGGIRSGIANRNLKRKGALKFNGWDPSPAYDQSLDNTSQFKAKGVFDAFAYYRADPESPETIRYAAQNGQRSLNTGCKWNSDNGKYPYSKTGIHWFPNEPYAVKHFQGLQGVYRSNSADVKFILKVERRYRMLGWPNDSSTWAIVMYRRPRLNVTMWNENIWHETPPWSKTNIPISSVTLKMYMYTSERATYKPHPTAPPPATIFDKMVPDKDYWQTVRLTCSAPSGNVIAEVENDAPRPYESRSELIQSLTSDGYLPWKARTWVDPYGANPQPEWWTDYSYYKEDGADLDSSASWDYSEIPWTGKFGIIARDASTQPFGYPVPSRVHQNYWSIPETDNSNAKFWNAAWRPPSNTRVFWHDEQYMRIKVYAVVGDACSPCYFKDLKYSLSVKYTEGTCEMADGDDSNVTHNFGSETSIDFDYQIPTPSNANDSVFLIKTIDWDDMSAGTCRQLTDFTLNSITNA